MSNNNENYGNIPLISLIPMAMTGNLSKKYSILPKNNLTQRTTTSNSLSKNNLIPRTKTINSINSSKNETVNFIPESSTIPPSFGNNVILSPSITSKIKVFIYEVLNLKELQERRPEQEFKEKYKFGKIKKSDGKTDKPIKPIQPLIRNSNVNRTKFFSRDIIETTFSSNNIKFLKNGHETSFNKLYKSVYLKYPTRVALNNFIENKEMYNRKTEYLDDLILSSINILFDYANNIINSPINLSEIKHKSEIVYRINADDDEKIIVIGDNHGSFHSLFRIFVRWYNEGIIDNDYKLKDGYRIIFLGDVIDRGNFGIEIMYMIFKLIIANNTKDKLTVILIRGNHEEEETYRRYGFTYEVQKKFRINHSIISSNFNTFYTFCPSAIILTHAKTTYWLCHGGFPLKYINDSQNVTNVREQTEKNFENNKTEKNFDNNYEETTRDTIYSIDNINNADVQRMHNKQHQLNNLNEITSAGRYKYIGRCYPDTRNIPTRHELIKINDSIDESQIRWNDFNSIPDTTLSSRNAESGSMFVIGTDNLTSFLKNTNIDFIIRGHTDNVSNAMLLARKKGDSHYILNDTRDKNCYNKYPKEIITYPIIELRKTENEVATIFPKKFKRKGVAIGNELELFPVLTISNNSDNDRMQYPDSYVMISI